MSNNSIRILLFTTAFRPFIGGSEIAIEEIARRLPEINFDIITPRYTKKLKSEENFGNIYVYRVGWGILIDKLLFPVAGFLKSRKLVLANNYRAIHAYQASQAAGATWILKSFYTKLPFILTLQEGKNLSFQGLLINFFRRLIIRKADMITAISNYLKDYAQKINPKTRAILIPNGVDVDKFSKQFSYGELTALEDKLGIKPDDKVILSASRLVYKNGIDVLIKAMAVLKDKPHNHTWKLILVGGGPLEENLRLKVKNLKLESDIIFTGSISHEDLPAYLKIADVFVRPSRSEGLGIAFLEAMAADIPVIGTGVGGIPDFLKSGETGLICQVNDSNDVAQKILEIIENQDLRSRIVQNASNLVKEKYQWDGIARKFDELYKQIK